MQMSRAQLLSLLSGCFPSAIEFREYRSLLKTIPRQVDWQDVLSVLPRGSRLSQALLKHCNWRADVDKALHFMEKKGIRWTGVGMECYPAVLYSLPHPPLFLSYYGHLRALKQPCLSVVGSREPRDETLDWMDQNLPAIVQRGITLVSGGARGVDQKAHAVSLRCGKPTVVLLPSGLAKVYPSSFSDWLEPIVENGGCVLSEYSLDTPMRKHHFLWRNRLIAALGRLTFVSEARRCSGSLITASRALELGRTVAVLPHCPLHPSSLGTVDLLTEGALPIRDALDLSLAMGELL